MHELPFQEGDTLMEVLTSEDLGVRAECGGCCACATCHVYVAPQWLDRLLPQSDDEIDMLDLAFAVETNSRLSCQIAMTPAFDGLEVTIAPDWD
ncbi:MAG TPA: 2Fe-2S iron-sulfur cluster-binding protein [Kiloniellaceae bacterium]